MPEGCPLAVTSMVAITWWVGSQLQARSHVGLRSFVDNWFIPHASPERVLHAVQQVSHSTDMLGMRISQKKLKFYSTDVGQRKYFRNQALVGNDLNVTLDFRDLGVYYCSAGRVSAKNFTGRFQTAQPRFLKLSVAPWSHYRQACMLTSIANQRLDLNRIRHDLREGFRAHMFEAWKKTTRNDAACYRDVAYNTLRCKRAPDMADVPLSELVS